MSNIRFRRPQSGTAIAFVALVAALSGTAVALPGKSTVDSGDIKNKQVKNADLASNAVTSGKVKDGKLLAKDFKAGELPAGAKGDKGDKGDTGAPGPDRTRLSVSRDVVAGPTAVIDGGQTEVNSAAITVPSSGTLLISGHAFVNNNGTAGPYTLEANINGVETTDAGWNSTMGAGAAGTTVAETFELSYTTPVPVNAGSYTITQTVGPFTGTKSFLHNNTELSVLFVPTP